MPSIIGVPAQGARATVDTEEPQMPAPTPLVSWSSPHAILVLVSMLMAPTAAVAQLKVLISGGFSGPYERLLPQFEQSTGIQVTTGSGSSQGTGPQTIGAQLARGVSADVVILSREGISDLIKAGRIAPGTDEDLARTPIGVAVSVGAPKPTVQTVEDFKRLVTRARLVAMPGSTSGIFLRDEVFPGLGTSLAPRGEASQSSPIPAHSRR
jgi:molybdate transport system substrate-binding protein